MAQKNIKDVIGKGWSYFNIGLAVLQKPLSLISFATTIYYLAFEKIPVLKTAFPLFRDFLISGGLLIVIVAWSLGWCFVRTPFYKKQFEIPAEQSPYATVKVQKVAIPFYEASIKHFEQAGIDTTELRKIVEASKK